MFPVCAGVSSGWKLKFLAKVRKSIYERARVRPGSAPKARAIHASPCNHAPLGPWAWPHRVTSALFQARASQLPRVLRTAVRSCPRLAHWSGSVPASAPSFRPGPLLKCPPSALAGPNLSPQIPCLTPAHSRQRPPCLPRALGSAPSSAPT